jgi:hypothetical protein
MKTKKPKAGRPPFRATKAKRDRVTLYIAGGIGEAIIAHRLGISPNTLQKHFADELKFGRDLKRAENLELLDSAAKSGNVAAQKHLDAKFAALAAGNYFAATAPPGPKLGKKEVASIAALDAEQGTEWHDLMMNTELPN